MQSTTTQLKTLLEEKKINANPKLDHTDQSLSSAMLTRIQEKLTGGKKNDGLIICLPFLKLNKSNIKKLCTYLENQNCPSHVSIDFHFSDFTFNALIEFFKFIERGFYTKGLTISLNISTHKIWNKLDKIKKYFFSAFINGKGPELHLKVPSSFFYNVITYEMLYTILYENTFLKTFVILDGSSTFNAIPGWSNNFDIKFISYALAANPILTTLKIDTSLDKFDSPEIKQLLDRNENFAKNQLIVKSLFSEELKKIPKDLVNIILDYSEVPTLQSTVDTMRDFAVKELIDNEAIVHRKGLRIFYSIMKRYGISHSEILDYALQNNIVLTLLLREIQEIYLDKMKLLFDEKETNVSSEKLKNDFITDITTFLQLADLKEKEQVSSALLYLRHEEPFTFKPDDFKIRDNKQSSPVTGDFNIIIKNLTNGFYQPGAKICIPAPLNKRESQQLCEALSHKNCPKNISVILEQTTEIFDAFSVLIKQNKYPENLTIIFSRWSLRTKSKDNFYAVLADEKQEKRKPLHLTIDFPSQDIVNLIIYNKNLKSLFLINYPYGNDEKIINALTINDTLTTFHINDLTLVTLYKVFYITSRNKQYEQGIFAVETHLPQCVIKVFRDAVTEPNTGRVGFRTFLWMIARNKNSLEIIFQEDGFPVFFRENMHTFFEVLIKIYVDILNRSEAREGGERERLRKEYHGYFTYYTTLIIKAAKITVEERSKLFSHLKTMFSLSTLFNDSTYGNDSVRNFEISLPVVESKVSECKPPVFLKKEDEKSSYDKKQHFGLHSFIPSLDMKHLQPCLKNKISKEISSSIKSILIEDEDYDLNPLSHIHIKREETLKNQKQLMKAINNNDLKCFHKTITNLFLEKKISIHCAFQLKFLTESEKTVPLTALKEQIDLYHRSKGFLRQLFKSSSDTAHHFTALYEIAKEMKWPYVTQTQIELCVLARDHRSSSINTLFFRKGMVKNSFSFFQSGTLPTSVQNKIGKGSQLSQTELLIFNLHQKCFSN